jgi:GntR family transcriptional regulator
MTDVLDQQAAYSLDLSSGVPLYLQVERSLLARIESGEWGPGKRVPPEGELAASYGVSRITVRQALARLTDRGLLARERGRGTFVRDQKLTAGARGVTSFTQELTGRGVKAGATILGQEVVTAADARVAEALEVTPDAPVLRLRRLRTGNGRPVGVQTSSLPLGRFPGLDKVDFTDRSLYAVLRERYGTVPTEAIETLNVIAVSSADAAILDVRRGTPAFQIERITLDARGRFEHVHSIMRGDRYQIRVVLREP